MSSFCTSCGTPVDGASFCPACGTPVTALPPVTSPAAPSAGAPSAAPGRSRLRWILAGIVALVLVVGGVVAALVLGGDDEPETPTETVRYVLDIVETGKHCDDARTYLSDDMWDGFQSGCEKNADADEDLHYEVGKADVDGDTASVVVHQGSGYFTLTLEKDGDHWVITAEEG